MVCAIFHESHVFVTFSSSLLVTLKLRPVTIDVDAEDGFEEMVDRVFHLCPHNSIVNIGRSARAGSQNAANCTNLLFRTAVVSRSHAKIILTTSPAVRRCSTSRFKCRSS